MQSVESASKKRGNPYRDANGRLTTKDKAVYDIRGNPNHDKAGKFASGHGAAAGKPLVVSREDFDTRFPDSDAHLYRGVKSKAGAEATRNGELGGGDFGKGVYLGSLGTAQGYMQSFQGDRSGVMLRAAIDKSKKPKIRKLPNKVSNKGSAEIDKWAEENQIDVVDVGSFTLVKNPGVLVIDSHDYTLPQSVAMDFKSKGYDLPAKYKDAADELGMSIKIREDRSESRASRLSTVERRIIKKPNICERCRLNDDPTKVPVHPHCDCDVITDSIESGVGDTQSRFLNPLHSADIEMHIMGEESVVPQGIQLDPDTAAILDAENVRFADIARWLETMQPYLEQGAQYLSIVVDDDTDEAVAQTQEVIAAAAEGSEQFAEAIKSRKLWFALAKAVAF